MKVAAILKGKKVHDDISLVISPGSSKILSKLAGNGALADMIDAGARIIENACGPCIGMGQSPSSGAVSLRTFNRNFKGRSGTADAQVYLVSPETAAISAVKGILTTGMNVENLAAIPEADFFEFNDNYIVYPDERTKDEIPVNMGPNIKPFPLNDALTAEVKGKVVLKTGDNITTDDIMPSNAKLLPYRSNIPHLSNFCFTGIDEDFPQRCNDNNGGIIIGGDNYGQGSSREHAALVPLYLGIKFILAKSFARIHRSNLINSGIIPIVFDNLNDYDTVDLLDEVIIENAKTQIPSGKVVVKNITKGLEYTATTNLSEEELEMILKGGKINMLKSK